MFYVVSSLGMFVKRTPCAIIAQAYCNALQNFAPAGTVYTVVEKARWVA